MVPKLFQSCPLPLMRSAHPPGAMVRRRGWERGQNISWELGPGAQRGLRPGAEQGTEQDWVALPPIPVGAGLGLTMPPQMFLCAPLGGRHPTILGPLQ